LRENKNKDDEEILHLYNPGSISL